MNEMGGRSGTRESIVTSRPRIWTDEAVAHVGLCAGIGAGCYVGYGLLFELFFMPALRIPGEPMLSYGQQAGMMMPLAGILGASVGVILTWRSWIARLIAITIPFLVAMAACSLWNDSLSRYGPDPSEQVLYVPLLFGAALSLAVVLALILLQICSSKNRVTGAAKPPL